MAVMQHDRQEVLAYLKHQQASAEEQRQAWNWVHQGENLFDNPWFLYDESGQPMDFISAMRTIYELRNENL